MNLSSCPNIILPKKHLKAHIEGNFCCRKCTHRVQKKQMTDFLAFISSELGLSTCQSDSVWLKYVRQSAKKSTPVFTKAGLNFSFIENGLAGDMQVRCKTCTRRLKGHVTRCGCDRDDNENVKFGHDNKQFSLSLPATIGTQVMGSSFYDAKRLTSMLGLPFMSWKSYKKSKIILVRRQLKFYQWTCEMTPCKKKSV